MDEGSGETLTATHKVPPPTHASLAAKAEASHRARFANAPGLRCHSNDLLHLVGCLRYATGFSVSPDTFVARAGENGRKPLPGGVREGMVEDVQRLLAISDLDQELVRSTGIPDRDPYAGGL
jgi:hypothetical protein